MCLRSGFYMNFLVNKMIDENTTITVSLTPKQAEALIRIYHKQDISNGELAELLGDIVWRIGEQLHNLQP